MTQTPDREALRDAIHTKIKEHGLRLTLPRRAICGVLARHGEEFLTVPQILDEAMDEAGAPIDPSTGYRTLDELARIGLVHHVHFGTQPGRWHLTIEHDHQHLACETCGSMTAIPESDLRGTFEHLRETYGFSVSPHHFAILGQCADCREREGHTHG